MHQPSPIQARAAIVEALQEAGLYRGKTANPMRLGLCSRSKDVIEPLIKPQWWVDCNDLAAQGVAVVREGRLQITPALFKDTWYDWLENIRDWCISRWVAIGCGGLGMAVFPSG